jgi:hypothetical protein
LARMARMFRVCANSHDRRAIPAHAILAFDARGVSARLAARALARRSGEDSAPRTGRLQFA